MSSLHYSYKIHLFYESLRNYFADHGFYTKLLKTYSVQSQYYPDLNSGDFWDSTFEDLDGLMPMEKWRIGEVVKLVRKDKSVINLGVGKGILEEKLFQKYPRIDYHGTDITSLTLNRLQQTYGKNKFSKQELTNLEIKSGSYDQVILLEVLEHIKPRYTFRVLSEVKRILKDKGELIISVPINEHLEKNIPENPNSHMRMYTTTLLITELRTSGFDIRRVLSAPAFHHHFKVKLWINRILKMKENNNIILLAQKADGRRGKEAGRGREEGGRDRKEKKHKRKEGR